MILKVLYRMVFRVLGLRVTECRMVRLWGFSALGCLCLGNIGVFIGVPYTNPNILGVIGPGFLNQVPTLSRESRSSRGLATAVFLSHPLLASYSNDAKQDGAGSPHYSLHHVQCWCSAGHSKAAEGWIKPVTLPTTLKLALF